MRDPACVFCKILDGQIPATKVFQDGACLAFLDIGPIAQGHALLIPAGHYVTLDEMPAEEAAALLKHLPALGRAVQQATGAEGFNVLQNNGSAAHQLVQHVHFHIIPRRTGDAFHFNWPAGKYTPGQGEALAERIRQGLV